MKHKTFLQANKKILKEIFGDWISSLKEEVFDMEGGMPRDIKIAMIKELEIEIARLLDEKPKTPKDAGI